MQVLNALPRRATLWRMACAVALTMSISVAARAQPCGGTATTTVQSELLPQPVEARAAPQATSRPSPIFVVEQPTRQRQIPNADQIDSGCISEFTPATQHGGAYMIVGPDHYLWYATNGATIARVDPTAPDTITEIGPLSGSALQLTIGPDGNIWFAEQGSYDCNQSPPSRIGRILARPPYTITEFPVPGPISVLYGIAQGADGNLWFSRIGAPAGCSDAGVYEIDSISPDAPNRIQRYPLPTALSTAIPALGKPYKLVAGPDGNLWFNISPDIGSISPITHKITIYPITGATGNFADINIGPLSDPDSIWFIPVINGQQVMGRIGTKPPHRVSLFPLNITGGVNSVVAGPDGNIWFTEARSNYAIGRFSVASHDVLEIPLSDDTYARAATCGPDGNLWFTETQNPLGLQGIPGRVARVQSLPGLGTQAGRLACDFQQLYMSSGGTIAPGAAAD